MKSFQKVLTLGTSVLALAFAANSAFAHAHGHNQQGQKQGHGESKQWEGQGPSIVVTADPADFNYSMTLKFKVKDAKEGTRSGKHVEVKVAQDGVVNALAQLKLVNPGQVLKIKHLSFKSADGKRLENCNMMKNSGFIAGAAAIDIAVSKDGCIVK
jgi:Cu/Ag efflux protein CusF